MAARVANESAWERGRWVLCCPTFLSVRNSLRFCLVWECKTDPVRFKWGFGEGRSKDKFAEASKIPIPKRRKLLAKSPLL